MLRLTPDAYRVKNTSAPAPWPSPPCQPRAGAARWAQAQAAHLGLRLQASQFEECGGWILLYLKSPWPRQPHRAQPLGVGGTAAAGWSTGQGQSPALSHLPSWLQRHPATELTGLTISRQQQQSQGAESGTCPEHHSPAHPTERGASPSTRTRARVLSC